MDQDGCCHEVNVFIGLEPAKQAEYLTMLAQEARLLQFSLAAEDPNFQRIGGQLQQALENAIDADGPDETQGARRELEGVLAGARDAGMQLTAELGEVDIDGVLGTMKMRVLSTLLAPNAPAATT